MSPTPFFHRATLALLASAALFAVAPAQSQTASEALTPDIQGISLSGAPFKIDKLRGKVVMVMHWSSDCPVCLDKMRELRLNTEGWAGKPFEVVLINSDRSIEAVREYQRIVSVTLPPALKFTQLWQKAPEFRQFPWVEIGRQPITWILDKQGKLVSKHQGRLPLEVWDQIADLL